MCLGCEGNRVFELEKIFCNMFISKHVLTQFTESVTESWADGWSPPCFERTLIFKATDKEANG